MTFSARMPFQFHPFHLVSPSFWPIFTSWSMFYIASNLVLTMHAFVKGFVVTCSSLFLIITTASFWWRDVISEGTYLGNHTLSVQKGLTMGFGSFVISEVLFFLAIFWAFFHSALSPTIEIGNSWPPLSIEAVNPFELPLLNTVILLGSGLTVTFSHHALIKAIRQSSFLGLGFTVILAVVFTYCQYLEYSYSSFTISDGVFGSSFYFGTGFHGLHVMIGTAFLFVGLWRIYAYHVTENHHIGLETAILYWHFVDVVWLFLFFSMYYWGS